MRERHYRSLLKGTTWRVLGTLDTIFLAWLFTGSTRTALTIGGVEVFTKIILYYMHERVWLRLPFGREPDVNGGPPIEKHRRSVIKGISWRAFGTLDTTIIALFVTGDPTKAFSIGFTEVFTKVFLFYLHERVWQRIPLGRRHEAPPAVVEAAPVSVSEGAMAQQAVSVEA